MFLSMQPKIAIHYNIYKTHATYFTYEPLTRRRYIWRGREFQRHLDDILEGLILISPLERSYPVQKLVQKDAQAPPIDGEGVSIRRNDLGRQILLGTDEAIGLGLGLRHDKRVLVEILETRGFHLQFADGVHEVVAFSAYYTLDL